MTGAPGVDDPHDGSPEIGVLVRRALRRHVNVDVVSEPAVDELGVSLVVDFVLAVIVCAPGVGVRRRTAEIGSLRAAEGLERSGALEAPLDSLLVLALHIGPEEALVVAVVVDRISDEFEHIEGEARADWVDVVVWALCLLVIDLKQLNKQSLVRGSSSVHVPFELFLSVHAFYDAFPKLLHYLLLVNLPRELSLGLIQKLLLKLFHGRF